MMKFFSTRDHDHIVTASQAIAQGLSDEGGLFVPERFPQVDVRALCQLNYPALAAAVVSEYLTDYSKDFLTEATRTTYGEAFGGKAGYLAPVEGDTYALELWHGPTCAFKDYALQLMPKLLVEAKKNLSRTEKTLILVATSGDTGKAALDGYHDIPGVEIAVFYPTGGTSEIQRLQMATQEGANVAVYAVRGNFDDAQTGVKRVFGDKAIAAKLAERNIRLSSANSINWGRLVPQIVYYFAAYAQLLKAGKIAFGDEEVPYIRVSESETHSCFLRSSKRILVYDRATQFDLLRAADVQNQGVVLWTTLGFKNFRHGGLVQAVCAQTVHRLRGKAHDLAVSDQLRCFGKALPVYGF